MRYAQYREFALEKGASRGGVRIQARMLREGGQLTSSSSSSTTSAIQVGLLGAVLMLDMRVLLRPHPQYHPRTMLASRRSPYNRLEL